MNNNEKLITSLREAADYLEAHPDIPPLTLAWLSASVYKKDDLKDAARAMGSFEKKVDDNFYVLRHAIGPLNIEVSIPRSQVCEKVVTWKCPDDPLLEIESEAVSA